MISQDNIFHAYSIGDKQFIDIVVYKKIVTHVHRHFTYTLVGKSTTGKIVTTLVNKSQWDKYDVPFEEKVIDKKINVMFKRAAKMKKKRKRKTKLPKNMRRCYNEEIEKWLAEHYDLDLDNLK